MGSANSSIFLVLFTAAYENCPCIYLLSRNSFTTYHGFADLKTMSKRVDSEQYYVTLEMFIADVKRMFLNARTYNSPETIYYKCATR